MTSYPLPRRSYLELGPMPTAVPCARLHAKHLAWEWGLNGLSDAIELLVSELVTNAVKAMAGRDEPAVVRLQLSRDDVRVLIKVWDADSLPPALKDIGEMAYPTLKKREGAACSWWRR